MPRKPRKPRPKHWSTRITEEGVELRLYEREGSAHVWYSVVEGGRKVRRSLGTSDRAEAEERARAIAQEVAEAREEEKVRPGTRLTLGALFGLYRREKVPPLAPYRQRASHSTWRCSTPPGGRPSWWRTSTRAAWIPTWRSAAPSRCSPPRSCPTRTGSSAGVVGSPRHPGTARWTRTSGGSPPC